MDKIACLEQYCNQNSIRGSKDVALREYCTFKIGGPADFMVWPGSEEQLAYLLRYLQQQDMRYMILGRGSNVLFSDRGYRGVIICLGTDFSQMELIEENVIACDAGASLMQLCRYALEKGLSGLEFAYGIPGTVGGGVYMNAGAYGGEMKDVLRSTWHLSPDGSIANLSGQEMELSYRHSVYTDSDKVITRAEVRLTPGDPEEIRGRMEDYMQRRRSKQPLEYPSAGSTFQRPQGAYASALIDQCGLKGHRVGGAMVSEKHAGFVISAHNATCADVLELMRQIQQVVLKQTGFQLVNEVKIIPEA